MRQRVQQLILGVAVLSALFVGGWVVLTHRPAADVTTESVQSFTDGMSLKGTNDNPAETSNVSIGDDGVISLTPVP